MRLARLLLPNSLASVIALERDGSLYDVAELERRLSGARADEAASLEEDFFRRVFALGGAGLDGLDDKLCRGERPTEARLFPGDFLWLPPCSPERSLLVQMEASGPCPRYRIGNARALLGHQASASFPADEERPDVEISIAAFVGEEIYAASAEEAERAIVGYAILFGWVARGEERRSGPTRARDFAASLGPVLVTKDEAGEVERARVRLRVGPDTFDLQANQDLTLAESVAFVSQHVALSPGDVVSGVPLAVAREALEKLGFGVTLEVAIERLGKLEARAVRGPEAPPYRKLSVR